jgi:hypothetical protein
MKPEAAKMRSVVEALVGFFSIDSISVSILQ